MIHTIVFDMAGVLVDVLWEECCDHAGFPAEIRDELRRATIANPFWPEFDRGVLSNEELVTELCRRSPRLEPEIRRLLAKENLKYLCRARSYSRPWVQSLKAAGYHVYIISNFPDAAYNCMLEDGRLDFIPEVDGKVISYEAKLNKPDPEIYRTLAGRYGIDPACAVFLDDLQENIEGAEKAGFHGIRFESREQAVRDLRAMGVRTD